MAAANGEGTRDDIPETAASGFTRVLPMLI